MERNLYKRKQRFWQWLIIIIGYSFPLIAYGQSIDSLILKHTDSRGKVMIDSLLVKGNILMHSAPANAMELARRAISIAEKQKNPLDLANSFQFQGVCYAQIKANFDSAFHYFDKAE